VALRGRCRPLRERQGIREGLVSGPKGDRDALEIIEGICFPRYPLRSFAGFAKDLYIGIYTRCGGLDSHRFSGKGQPGELWNDLFAYYFELWVADKTLSALDKLRKIGELNEGDDENIAKAIGLLFDKGASLSRGTG
jgi:hypothetical protein